MHCCMAKFVSQNGHDFIIAHCLRRCAMPNLMLTLFRHVNSLYLLTQGKDRKATFS